MLDWFVEGMKQLVSHANGTDVQLLLENAPFTHLPTGLDMKDTAAVTGPEVGVNLDICNSANIEENPAAGIRMLGNLVKNVHISAPDTTNSCTRAWARAWSSQDRLRPRFGTSDIPVWRCWRS